MPHPERGRTSALRRAASLALLTCALVASSTVAASRAGANSAPPLPNGRGLTPAGRLVTAGDFPAAALLAPSGSLYLANAGENPNQLNTFDAQTLAAVSTLPVAPSVGAHSPNAQSGSLALSPDHSTLYVGGGTTGSIQAFTATAAPIQTKSYAVGPYVGGIAASLDGQHVFATLPFDPSAPYDKGTQLARLDTTTSFVTTLSVGRHPLAVIDGRLPSGIEVVIVANRDDGTISVIDAQTLATMRTVSVGDQPAALALIAGGRHLIVVNSRGDSVMDIDTSTWTSVSTLSLRAPTGAGAAPSALTVSADGARIYVALSADNALAVVQRSSTGTLSLLGRIPTAVYPTAVALDPVHGNLLVTSGKGVEQEPPQASLVPGAPVPPVPVVQAGSGGAGVSGTLEQTPIPTTQTALNSYSAQVAQNNAWTTTCCSSGPPTAIKHVIYIIRENKTYDEEFGDEPGGLPANLLYGRAITPNTHALAERSALLEGFYADEEVSDTGHQAAMGAVVNDWVQRFTQQAYGLDRAPNQDAEDGNGDNVLWSPANYLLDNALAHGVNFRDYGEFYRQSQTTASTFGPAVSTALDSHIVHNFPGFGFNLGVTDTTRVNFWLQSFTQDVANHTLPSLEVIYLPEDHTTLGAANTTPQQQVADSDYATGRIIDALSHSSYWTSSAVFLTEDDPQSGVDHVDLHRTIGLAVSPWIAAGTQSTIHYDQAGMLRTMEGILHLPPMTEFDATSRPMYELFNSGKTPPNPAPYNAVAPVVTLPAPALQAALHKRARRELGAHPDFGAVDPRIQRDLQWFAVHGKS